MKSTFYNTTHESDQLAFNFTEVNESYNKDVLEVFKQHPDMAFTPYEIGDRLPMLQSSIKRAISDLTALGYLVNTGLKKKERYGRNNYLWKLNK